MLVMLGKQADQHTVTSVPRPHWWHRVLPHRLSADVIRLGVLAGLLLGLSRGLSYGLSRGLSYGPSNGLDGVLINGITGLSAGLGDGLSVGLSLGATGIFLSLLLLGKTGSIELAERLGWSRKQIRGSLLNKRHLEESARLFLLLLLFIGLFTTLSSGLSHGLSIGWSSGQITGLSGGLRDGLGGGLAFGLISGLGGLSLVASISMTYWLFLGLWNGLSREIFDDHLRTKPNQGIRRSVGNALLVGVVTGDICLLVGRLNGFIVPFLSLGLNAGLTSGLNEGLSFGLSAGLNTHNLSLGLRDGILLGGTGFLLAALLTGGLASLRHLLLRLLLRRLGMVPRHYVRFLDNAARRILLYKDGGGYRFMHRLLFDYFADLETESS